MADWSVRTAIRTTALLALGAFVGAAAYAPAAARQSRRDPVAEARSIVAGRDVQRHDGRWQVVNGTPEMARNIMLLDTDTGATWIICNDKDGNNTWCAVPRTDGLAGGGQ